MPTRNDNPGVYFPPPLAYGIMFFLSILLYNIFPFNDSFFLTSASKIIGIIFIAVALFFNIPALRQFFKTKNTLVTMRPAKSLQTSGIYSVSRNPMYLSLLLVYTGLTFLFGNWWTLILLPFLITFVTYFIIKPEERYLERAFGQTYLDYKEKVRRWI